METNKFVVGVPERKENNIHNTPPHREYERRRLGSRLLPVCDLLGKSLIAKESVNVKSGVFPVIYGLRWGLGGKSHKNPTYVICKWKVDSPTHTPRQWWGR